LIKGFNRHPGHALNIAILGLDQVGHVCVRELYTRG
jgi:hypothetical protein